MEAVQKASELHPDLILLDIGLPQLNGIEAAKQIQLPSTQIIFVTINSDADFARVALSNGVQGYVVKTYAARELWSSIEAALHGKQYVSTGLSLPFKVTPN